MAKRFIKIQDDHGGPVEIIGPIGDRPSHAIVEAWQRGHWRTSLTGRPEPCTWQIVEAGNMVDALIQGAKRF